METINELIAKNNWRLEKVWQESPEQYALYDKKEELIGYMRVRWGEFLAKFPNDKGKTVYYYRFGKSMKGGFDSDEEREEHLMNALKAIEEEIKPVEYTKAITVKELIAMLSQMPDDDMEIRIGDDMSPYWDVELANIDDSCYPHDGSEQQCVWLG